MKALSRKHIAWIILIFISVTLHLWALDDRAFHHDEAVHGWFTYNLAFNGDYRYSPTFHGPFMYYFGSTIFWLLGDSDFSARLVSVIFGIGMLWVAWRLQRPFGARAAWWAGLLVTVSPLYLYFGRFFRHDLLELFFASSALICLYTALKWPSQIKQWAWIGIWSGLAVSTKENAYVTVVILIVTFLMLGFIFGFKHYIYLTRQVIANNWRGGVVASGWFLIITITLYTAIFRYPEDWNFPVKAIRYWTEQHDIERVAGPWWYHLFRLIQYEYLILVAATVWVFRRNRLRLIEVGLFIFGVVSIVMYAYLGEKVAWLAIHQIWAFVPLAAAQIARTFGPKGVWWSKTITAIGLILTIITSITANFILDEITPAQSKVESLHYVQTSPELKQIANQILRIDAQNGEPVAMIAKERSWPLVWYLRNASIDWGLKDQAQFPPIIIVAPDKKEDTCVLLNCNGKQYQQLTIPVRASWRPESKRPTIKEYIRYLLTREPWVAVQVVDSVVFQQYVPAYE